MSAEVIEPTAPAATEPVSAPPSPAPLVTEAVPSIIDRAKAVFKSKPDLQAEVTQLRTTTADFRTQLSEAQSLIQSLTEENEALKAQETALTSIIEAAEANAKTVTAAATDMVAATGVPAEALPAQDDQSVDSLDALQEKLANTSDPVEKGILAAKVRALR